MSNEAVFLIKTAVVLGAVVLAGRAGRMWLGALVAVCAVTMNLIVVKPIALFGLGVTCGNVLYAGIFLATDVLNEHYGRRAAQQAVWIGFAAVAFVTAVMQLALAFTSLGGAAQAHLSFFFRYTGYARIVAASMASFLIFQSLDVWVFDRIRHRTAGRLLWLRNNGSTWLSQLGDSLFFSYFGLWSVPWLGLSSLVPDLPSFWQLVGFTYAVKLVVAVLDTPVLYLTCWRPLRPPGSLRGQPADTDA